MRPPTASGPALRRPGALAAELGGAEGIEIVDAADVIGSSDEPAAAVRAKPDSSMVTACRLVRDGSAEAVVSAGPTGAMLAASLLHIGRIRGISRPGIGVPLPAQGGPVPPDRLRREPRRPGREPAPVRDHGLAVHARRDGRRARRTWACSRSARSRPRATRSRSRPTRCWRPPPALHFAGNCEGRDVLTGRFQVVVADGFAGNVLLKGLEGAAAALLSEVRRAAESSPRAKIGGLLLRPAAARDARPHRSRHYGGAYLLGLRGLVVDRPRQRRPEGDRERDPDRRTRSRGRCRGAAGRAACGGASHF